MEREMDMRLYEVLRTGNVTSLLLEENQVILDRFLTEFVSQTPLHFAILSGDVKFAKEILRRMPQLAHVLSSQGFSPLHMASANGSADIVKELLPLIVDVCHDRDKKGWTPVHAAAMKGHVNVLEVFTSLEWIRDMTDRDETVLHLCVKYNQLDALKTLIGFVGDDGEFVNRKDENGNTILHLAAMKKDILIMKYLVTETEVEINAMNMNGLTALDVFALCPSKSGDMEVVNILRQKGAERSWEMSTAKADNGLQNVLAVVGALTATLSFEAALTPPGGLWQDDANMGFNDTLHGKNHTAGTSILADKNPDLFFVLQGINFSVFLTSVIIICLGALPVKIISHKKCVSVMLQILPCTLASVSLMLYICQKAHTPKYFHVL